MVKTTEALLKPHDVDRAGVPPLSAGGDGTSSLPGFVGTSPRAFHPFRHRPAFTLVEVLVASAVLALISTGLLATSWRLAGISRDYVDQTVADSYCHDVLYTVTASTNKFGQSWPDIKDKPLSWNIDVTNHLPRIVSTTLFGEIKVVYPLWRTTNTNHYPKCEIVYTNETKVSVTVSWDWDVKTGCFKHQRTATGACR